MIFSSSCSILIGWIASSLCSLPNAKVSAKGWLKTTLHFLKILSHVWTSHQFLNSKPTAYSEHSPHTNTAIKFNSANLSDWGWRKKYQWNQLSYSKGSCLCHHHFVSTRLKILVIEFWCACLVSILSSMPGRCTGPATIGGIRISRGILRIECIFRKGLRLFFRWSPSCKPAIPLLSSS